MVNLPRGQEVSGLHGAPSQLQGEILRLVRLDGLSVASFVPRSLLLTLDAALAECWLDTPATSMPPALAWHLATEFTQASLAVQLPHHPTDMTRWARKVIQHGH